jgi:hypothetical protein
MRLSMAKIFSKEANQVKHRVLKGSSQRKREALFEDKQFYLRKIKYNQPHSLSNTAFPHPRISIYSKWVS